jgi:hypothetical protein
MRRTCNRNTPLASAGFATRVRRPVNRATLLSCRTTTQSLSPEPPVRCQRARRRQLPRRSPSGAVSESNANEEMTGALPRHSPARTTEPPLGRNCQMRAWCDGQHTWASLCCKATQRTRRSGLPSRPWVSRCTRSPMCSAELCRCGRTDNRRASAQGTQAAAAAATTATWMGKDGPHCKHLAPEACARAVSERCGDSRSP